MHSLLSFPPTPPKEKIARGTSLTGLREWFCCEHCRNVSGGRDWRQGKGILGEGRFDMSPSIYLSNAFFLFGTTRCSRLIFYFTCPSFSLRYFSKEPWFLLLENCFKKPSGPSGFNFLIGQTKKLRCK